MYTLHTLAIEEYSREGLTIDMYTYTGFHSLVAVPEVATDKS